MTRARDTQRQRVYDAERALSAYWGQTIPNDRLQAEANRILDLRAVRSRWGHVRIRVGLGRGGGRGGWGHINLGVEARNPTVLCHEIAHCLMDHTHSDLAPHGPEFTGINLFLLEHAVSKERSDALRAAYREHRVKVSRAAIPGVRAVVAPSAAIRETEQRAASRKPLEGVEPGTLARLLRRAIASGEFGPSGTAARDRALATARHIEKGHSL